MSQGVLNAVAMGGDVLRGFAKFTMKGVER